MPLFDPRPDDQHSGLCITGLVRHFTDGDGGEWRVCERTFGHLDTAAPRTSLIFEAARLVRRVRSYPADWHLLPDRELESLSWSR